MTVISVIVSSTPTLIYFLVFCFDTNVKAYLCKVPRACILQLDTRMGEGSHQSLGELEWEDSSPQFRQCVLAPPKLGFPRRQCSEPPPHFKLRKKFTFHLAVLKINKQIENFQLLFTCHSIVRAPNTL
jgi:hypothetical protein